MGKKMAGLALLLGAFLLTLAAFSKFYMYDRLAVVPQNNTTTSISQTADGNDAEYLDIANGLTITNGPLKSTRIVKGDVKLSEEASDELDRDVAVWKTYSCTDTPTFQCGGGQTPLSGSYDVVAFDRHTGESIEWSGTSHETGGEVTEPAEFDGLYFKFPFDTKKKNYKFWDGTLNEATTARYVGESDIDGLKVYEFEQTIEPTMTGTIDVPGDLVGSEDETVTADRYYSNTRTFKVEPTTGVIIVGGESQDSFLELEGQRVLTTTAATLEYTDENTQNTVDEYRGKAQLLGIVKSTFPIVGTILGFLLLVAGFVIGRTRDEGQHV